MASKRTLRPLALQKVPAKLSLKTFSLYWSFLILIIQLRNDIYNDNLIKLNAFQKL